MLLAVDVGNTQTVLGLFEETVLAHHWRISTNAERTSDELALLVSDLAAPDAGAGCGVPAALQATSRTPTAMDNSHGRRRVRSCLVRIAVPLPWCQLLPGQASALGLVG